MENIPQLGPAASSTHERPSERKRTRDTKRERESEGDKGRGKITEDTDVSNSVTMLIPLIQLW